MKTFSASTAQSLLFQPWAVVPLLWVAATVAGLLLERHISLTSQAMLYVLAVVLASYTLGWVESVVCAVGAVVAFNFFFVPPRWTFEVDGREHLITLFTMLLVALTISHLAAGLRREAEMARLNARRAQQLQELASGLSGLTSAQDMATMGRVALDEAFAGPNLLVLRRPDGELDTPEGLAPAVRDGLLCCMREVAVLGPGTGRWPGLDAWYLPLGDKQQTSGAALVQPALASDTGGREHAQALCTLVWQALLRLSLDSSMRAAQSEAQHQQLQSTYLAAISHDLRTPLAAVVGAASALQTQRDKLSPQEQDRLLGSIVSEASYLCNLTENTLQLVSLSNAPGELHRDWESMEEIVGAVLARVRGRDPARRIKSQVPEGLPLIKADPVLLAQLLDNLLDNALKYSIDAIDLSVSARAHEMQVCVKDRGPGIAPEDQASMFEPYTRGDVASQRGAGLGLALCRAIAHAHGGTLAFEQRSGGGSNFILTLPMETQQPGSLTS
ncbi:MAG: two-component system OmpR family sensor histidine kinase KdpD [Comamonadaceae bacterium]|nr:MAG: two-component system OmpR family sensor histidine kinase KdpD [Comamonadaceae bacterium]